MSTRGQSNSARGAGLYMCSKVKTEVPFLGKAPQCEESAVLKATFKQDKNNKGHREESLDKNRAGKQMGQVPEIMRPCIFITLQKQQKEGPQNHE